LVDSTLVAISEGGEAEREASSGELVACRAPSSLSCELSEPVAEPADEGAAVIKVGSRVGQAKVKGDGSCCFALEGDVTGVYR
jgi:hypothetical protein